MRGLRYVFAVIVRVHHETLRRIVSEAQVAPGFCTGAPKHEKLRFSAEIDGFLRASCWTQAEYFCRSWACVRESPKHRQKVVASVDPNIFYGMPNFAKTLLD